MTDTCSITVTQTALASHEDRDRAVQELQEAFMIGRLNEPQLEMRVSQALNARDQDELTNLLADVRPVGPTLRMVQSQLATAVFSNIERSGHIVVPESYQALALMGCCTLDLSLATFAAPNTRIRLKAIMGCIDVIVPRDIRVHLHQTPIFGGISCKVFAEEHSPTMPTLHIDALAVFGSIELRAK